MTNINVLILGLAHLMVQEKRKPQHISVRPTTALYLYAKLALMRTLHRDIVCSLFSYEVVVRPRNEQYVLCLLRKHVANIANILQICYRLSKKQQKSMQKVAKGQQRTTYFALALQ